MKSNPRKPKRFSSKSCLGCAAAPQVLRQTTVPSFLPFGSGVPVSSDRYRYLGQNAGGLEANRRHFTPSRTGTASGRKLGWGDRGAWPQDFFSRHQFYFIQTDSGCLDMSSCHHPVNHHPPHPTRASCYTKSDKYARPCNLDSCALMLMSIALWFIYLRYLHVYAYVLSVPAHVRDSDALSSTNWCCGQPQQGMRTVAAWHGLNLRHRLRKFRNPPRLSGRSCAPWSTLERPVTTRLVESQSSICCASAQRCKASGTNRASYLRYRPSTCMSRATFCFFSFLGCWQKTGRDYGANPRLITRPDSRPLAVELAGWHMAGLMVSRFDGNDACLIITISDIQ